MRTSKKLLSVLLAVLMCMSCFGLLFSSFAADDDPIVVTSIAATSSFQPTVGGAFPTESDFTALANGTVPLSIIRVNVSEVDGDSETFRAGKIYQVLVGVQLAADSGYAFRSGGTDVTINGEPSNCSPAYERYNKTLAAFVFEYRMPANITVSCDPAEGGTVTGGGTYELGSTATLSATANPGYVFEGWSKVSGFHANPYTDDRTFSLTVDQNYSFVAVFSEDLNIRRIDVHPKFELLSGTPFPNCSDFDVFINGGTTKLTVNSVNVRSPYENAAPLDIPAFAGGYKSYVIELAVSCTSPTVFTSEASLTYDGKLFHGEYEYVNQTSAILKLQVEVPATRPTATGRCGENVTWTYNETTGALVISGTGMTYTSDYARFFRNMKKIKSVTISNGVEFVRGIYEDEATQPMDFDGCNSLEVVSFSSGIAVIPGGMFYNCPNLVAVSFGSGLNRICSDRWDSWGAIRDVFYTGSEEEWENITVESSIINHAAKHFNTSFNVCDATFSTITLLSAEHGTSSGGGRYITGGTAQLKATPDYGYQFSGWYYNPHPEDPGSVSRRLSSNENYSFTVSQDMTIEPRFEKHSWTVTVEANDPAYGTVTGGGDYLYETTATVSATPKNGYGFRNWTKKQVDNEGVYHEAVVSEKTNYTFTVRSDVTMIANFEKLYQLTLTAGEGGRVSQSGEYLLNSWLYASAFPNDGYEFDGWYEGDTKVSDADVYRFCLYGDTALEARFKWVGLPKYNITVNATEGGTVTGAGEYDKNTEITVTATPNEGCIFDGWFEFDDWYEKEYKVSSNESYSFTVTYDRVLTAKFIDIPSFVDVRLETDGLKHGDWYFDQDACTDWLVDYYVESGTNLEAARAQAQTDTAGLVASLQQLDKFGYDPTSKGILLQIRFGDGSVSTEVYTQRDGILYELYASGIKQYRDPAVQTYTVTANASAGGSATGGNTYESGATATLTATPNSGYHFTGWYEGSTKVSDKTPYSFTVTKDVTLTAQFEKDADPGNNGGNNNPQPQPSANRCHWCGKDHSGNFFQKIIGFFHNIFAKIFGNKY